MKSEEIKDIAGASMALGEVDAIRTTEPIFILIEKGRSLRNLLIKSAAYDIAQPREILPI